MKELGVLTKRWNELTADQQAIAIDVIGQEDPLGRWGGELIQEKLGQKSIHIAQWDSFPGYLISLTLTTAVKMFWLSISILANSFLAVIQV